MSARPRLDLSLPDLPRQVAEFCLEFPKLGYDEILRLCRLMEERLSALSRDVEASRSPGV